MAKHLYMLIGAAPDELVSVLVASMTIGRLGSDSLDMSTCSDAASVFEFLNAEYALEHAAVEFNFLAGLLGFATMVAIRAWTSFACPTFAKIAVCTVAAAVFVMLSFADFAQERSFGAVGVRFISLLVQRAWQTRSLLLTAGLVTAGYGLYFFVKDLPVFVAMLVGKM